MGAVAVGAILFAVLLVVAAILVWQESRRAGDDGVPEYVIDEASGFVHERLPPDAAARLDRGDVTSILEWGLYHKQVVVGRGATGTPVLGSEAEVDYVAARAASGKGAAYQPADVAEVLALEAEYLAFIGAIGEPVDEESS